MTQLQKYTWLIDTIRRSGKISMEDLSYEWERTKDLSDLKPLSRSTFNRWKEAIFEQFGIIISCQRAGGYKYYIENPESIDNNELKKWMLDSFAIGKTIEDHLSLKDRILVDQIPSGRYYLTTLLDAMKGNSVVNLTYKSFKKTQGDTYLIEPYCVKLFEHRWYVLAHNLESNDIRLYALDRIQSLAVTDKTFNLPKGFSPEKYFSNYYGIVADEHIKPTKIVIRANRNHAPYLKTLPLHHSQQLIEDNGVYADFELFLAPTYDFIMKLLQMGPMIEVTHPTSLRKEMKGWISEMYELYKND
jgi:hypothetical protein